MQLIIVESPTKSRTIQRFLGKEYKVLSSFGHIRDLPKREFGVDVEKDFTPKYVIPPKAKKVINELKKASEKAEATILATDEDREGESISWHLQEALKLKNPKRIVFHEITEDAIKKALESPRTIDINLVNAQQARRILDRIFGYKLSPFLWKKVAKGLSAGRVQSVAVRLVVEREREIQKFTPQEYWTIEATLKKHGSDSAFTALLSKKDDVPIEVLEIRNQQEADAILEDLTQAEYRIAHVERKAAKRNPFPPFTTSTLQQSAWQKFHFPAKMTMSLAQKLYEEGYITYHRTDSLNLSDTSLHAARKFITETMGAKYHAARKYKAKGNAEEAHEAIRPTYANRTPESLKGALDGARLKLYQLIWQRFIASQMASAGIDATSIHIQAKRYTFLAHGQMLTFDGFLKVYPVKFQETQLPQVKEQELLELANISENQHFTQPPPRYNEASLIKALEKHGVGRPSTYAPTLSTIQERHYLEKNDQKKFTPTEMGIIVNDILVEHFPQVVDIDFTAAMEKELDEIAEGKDTWQKTCREFYEPFAKTLEEKYHDVPKENLALKTDKFCPKCGKPMVERLGRFGRFYACSGFPECKHTESLEKEPLGVACPKCRTGQMAERKTKKGKIFYGCSNFPKCNFALWDKPINEQCPDCGSILVQTKAQKIKCPNKDCGYRK